MARVDCSTRVPIQRQRFRILNNLTVLPPKVIPHKIDDQNPWKSVNRARFISINFLFAAIAVVLVVARQLVCFDEITEAVFERELEFLEAGDLQGEGAVLGESVGLVSATLTEHLAPGLKPKHLKNGSAGLVGDYILLNRVCMVEARLDQMVEKSEQELLGVLLLAPAVRGHDAPHEGLNQLHVVYALGVCFFDIRFIDA